MVNVVIPVHNRCALTRKCLECLSRQAASNIRVIVVDDGSMDGTAEMIRNEFPTTILLTGDGNLWWSEGTNVGVRYALQHRVLGEDNFILTLNDDTEIQENYISSLLTVYSSYKPCLVGSVSVDIREPDSLQYAGMKLNLYSANETYLADTIYNNKYSLLRELNTCIQSDSLSGRGVLIPFEVFEKIGLYDSKHYVHYMADIEFSVRARQAGYPLIISPESVVFEHVEATGMQVNQSLTLRKFWFGLWSQYSPINLRMRYHFAMKYTRTKQLYLLLETARIVTGFFLRKLRVMHY